MTDHDPIEAALRRELHAAQMPHDDVRAERMIQTATDADPAGLHRGWVAPLAAAAAVATIGGGIAIAVSSGPSHTAPGGVHPTSRGGPCGGVTATDAPTGAPGTASAVATPAPALVGTAAGCARALSPARPSGVASAGSSTPGPVPSRSSDCSSSDVASTTEAPSTETPVGRPVTCRSGVDRCVTFPKGAGGAGTPIALTVNLRTGSHPYRLGVLVSPGQVVMVESIQVSRTGAKPKVTLSAPVLPKKFDPGQTVVLTATCAASRGCASSVRITGIAMHEHG